MNKQSTRSELTARRIALGISRAALAIAIGVREQTLFRWERGGIVNVPDRSMADWERALDALERERRTA